jgi:hypothetical protein
MTHDRQKDDNFLEDLFSEEFVVMKEDPFQVVVSDDNNIAVEFSEAFLALSIEEQLKAMRAFYWQKSSEPQAAFDVSKEAVKREMTIALAESMMGNLKRGQPVERDGLIDINIDDLLTVWTTAE